MLSTSATKIGKLTPDLFNATVQGVILYRSASRSSKTFTILVRDSPEHSIVCDIWSPQSAIEDLWEKCSVGQAISVSRLRILPAASEYHPFATSALVAVGSEHSRIGFPEMNCVYRELLCTPMRPVNLALNLEDIRINGEKGIGQLVDVCVLVRQMKPARKITLKSGKGTKQLREIVVCDKSCPGMLLTLWSEDFLVRSENWQPSNQVLHVVDVKIGFSSYYKSIFLLTTTKTLIMDNPSGPGTRYLLDMGLHLEPFDSTAGNHFGNSLPSAEDISEVMSCQRVVDRLSSNEGRGDEDQFSAVVYGIVSRFDLDQARVTKRKWWDWRIVMQILGFTINVCPFQLLLPLGGDRRVRVHGSNLPGSAVPDKRLHLLGL